MAKRKRVPEKIRDKLLADALFRCCLCPQRTQLTVEKHHILPVSEGGPNTEDNLIVVCGNCHDAIHLARDAGRQVYTEDQILECKRRWIELCWRPDLTMEQRIQEAPALRPDISLAKLPNTGTDLFGREEQLKILDDAWADRHTHVVALTAPGGVGKSAIANYWLREMEKDDYRGARRVFGWSFYSQGQRETAVSADQFIHEALRFFGDPDPSEGNAWQRAERLAQLIRQQPTILVVDGLEPIQSYDPGDLGKIKDPALKTLLCELSRGTKGICVITSRLEPTDIALSDEGGPARRIDLPDLTAEAGIQLLHARGVKGPEDELLRAVEDLGRRALALVLLAEYLREFHGGDISRRSEVPLMDKELEHGGHAWRVVQADDFAFKREGAERERAILRIIGLFDRPAARPCLDALRAEPAIAGVTDAVVGLSDDEWNHCLARLRRLRLVSPAPAEADSLDAHPLVREYFGRKLQQESPEGFRQAHGRLYEYLRDHGKPTPDTDSDTFQDLLPLYQAVHHGCRAGKHQEALHEILWRRIRRTDEHFSLKKLGTFGADLAALGGFFEQRWTVPATALSGYFRAWVLGDAGSCLRALGRLDEAVQPMRVSLELLADGGDFKHAATAASNLGWLLQDAGRLEEAASAAGEAVGLADRSEYAFERLSNRSHRASVIHARGRLADATRDFKDAERMQKGSQPEFPLLYSLQGARYCWLLLDLGRAKDVAGRASRTLAWAEQYFAPNDIGLDHLSLGRASHLLALAAGNEEAERLEAEARAHLDAAVEGIRKAGTQHHVPRGLLARAAFHREFGGRNEAERDLTEALTLAERHGFRLHETDARLLQGHMALDEDPPDAEAAQEALERAQELVEKTGYHLRDADLLILEGRVLAKRGDTEAGRTKLEEAIKVARREEDKGCVYQLAVDEANRYLKELEA